jgi:hypothetical protein
MKIIQIVGITRISATEASSSLLLCQFNVPQLLDFIFFAALEFIFNYLYRI